MIVKVNLMPELCHLIAQCSIFSSQFILDVLNCEGDGKVFVQCIRNGEKSCLCSFKRDPLLGFLLLHPGVG